MRFSRLGGYLSVPQFYRLVKIEMLEDTVGIKDIL